jgi:hypothetical protein
MNGLAELADVSTTSTAAVTVAAVVTEAAITLLSAVQWLLSLLLL